MIQNILDKLKVIFHNYREDCEKLESEIERLIATKNRVSNCNEKLLSEIKNLKIKHKDDYDKYVKMLTEQTFKIEDLKKINKKINSAKGGYKAKIKKLEIQVENMKEEVSKTKNECKNLILKLEQENRKLKNKIRLHKIATTESSENYREKRTKYSN